VQKKCKLKPCSDDVPLAPGRVVCYIFVGRKVCLKPLAELFLLHFCWAEGVFETLGRVFLLHFCWAEGVFETLGRVFPVPQKCVRRFGLKPLAIFGVSKIVTG